MSTRWEWFKVACEIAEMLQGEPQDQRPAIMAQKEAPSLFLRLVEDEG